MREYPVKITEKALGDMNGIYEYIAVNLQSPENAMGQYNRMADCILGLGFFPEKFGLVDFEPERSQGLRRMLVDNYSVFYVFKDETVTVTKEKILMDNSYLAKIETISKGIKNSVKDKEKADMLFDRLESSISRILKYSSVKVESSGIDLLKGMYDDETYR
jgi:plasmid stabilization system protein ParE